MHVPTGKPEDMASTQEVNLTTSVRTLKIFGRLTPFRYPITSGMPDPPAGGCGRAIQIQRSGTQEGVPRGRAQLRGLRRTCQYTTRALAHNTVMRL